MKKLIIIEHLEDMLSQWLLAEYRKAYEYARENLLITNIELRDLPSTKKRFYEIIDPRELVILDPQADKTLMPEETCRFRAFVIGGILGDHPPRGRTKTLLSDRFPDAEKRNIGDKQFSVDGAVYIVREIIRGRRLEEIPVVYGVRIIAFKKDLIHEIYLPYAYPLDERGEILISRDLLRYLLGSYDNVEVYYDEVIYGKSAKK